MLSRLRLGRYQKPSKSSSYSRHRDALRRLSLAKSMSTTIEQEGVGVRSYHHERSNAG